MEILQTLTLYDVIEITAIYTALFLALLYLVESFKGAEK